MTTASGTRRPTRSGCCAPASSPVSALYKGELEPAWPDEHWDHWMRSEVKFRTSRGRECLIPQVPRTYHHGEQGTFMIKRMHELYFARIAHNTDPRVTWPTSEWPALRARLRHDGYVYATPLGLGFR